MPTPGCATVTYLSPICRAILKSITAVFCLGGPVLLGVRDVVRRAYITNILRRHLFLDTSSVRQMVFDIYNDLDSLFFQSCCVFIYTYFWVLQTLGWPLKSLFSFSLPFWRRSTGNMLCSWFRFRQSRWLLPTCGSFISASCSSCWFSGKYVFIRHLSWLANEMSVWA